MPDRIDSLRFCQLKNEIYENSVSLGVYKCIPSTAEVIDVRLISSVENGFGVQIEGFGGWFRLVFFHVDVVLD